MAYTAKLTLVILFIYIYTEAYMILNRHIPYPCNAVKLQGYKLTSVSIKQMKLVLCSVCHLFLATLLLSTLCLPL